MSKPQANQASRNRLTTDGFAEALLGKVKDALKITHSHSDEEFIDIINACKQDLSLAGVSYIFADEPLCIRAVILYAKAHFSFNEDLHRFQISYDSVKNLLRLSGDNRV